MKKAFAGMTLAVAGIALLVATFASAHPQLSETESFPQPDQVLQSSPEEVRLIFPSGAHDGIDAEISDVWIVQVQGDLVVAHGGVDLDSADRNEMFVTFEEPLRPGLYRVEWVAVSLGDNGFTSGNYEFAVEEPET